MFKLYNENNELLVKGDSYAINNYMMFNGIEYTYESIESNEKVITIHYDNGDKLVIEKIDVMSF